MKDVFLCIKEAPFFTSKSVQASVHHCVHLKQPRFFFFFFFFFWGGGGDLYSLNFQDEETEDHQ